MKKFEIGKTYFATSACDHDCIYTVEITSRTEKTVTYIQDGERQRRSRIQTDGEGEFIQPDRYSMAPIFRASREKAKETPADESATDIQVNKVIMVGQRVEMNCGCMFAVRGGTVRLFIHGAGNAPEALIEWDGDDETPSYKERVRLDDIHPAGYKSANGSGIGVFVV